MFYLLDTASTVLKNKGTIYYSTLIEENSSLKKSLDKE